MNFLNAFWVGGLICVVGQIILLKTNITPARILVLFVTLGVALTLIGVYEPLVEFAGGGATVPLTGFGYSLAMGAQRGIEEHGLLGIFSGGVSAMVTAGAGAAGVTAAAGGAEWVSQEQASPTEADSIRHRKISAN